MTKEETIEELTKDYSSMSMQSIKLTIGEAYDIGVEAGRPKEHEMSDFKRDPDGNIIESEPSETDAGNITIHLSESNH